MCKYISRIKKKFSWLGLKADHKNNSGYTLVELLVAIGILVVMVTIGTIGLSSIQHKSYLSSAVNTFKTDFKEQQIKAMTGDTEGAGSTYDYGIYFTANTYTLFRSSYGTSNFVIDLPSSVNFTNAGSQIVFTKGSGETSATIVTMKDIADGSQKTVTINRFGVITAVN